MYNWERSKREKRPTKNPKNPSFSSALLDQIYRSIDEDNCQERSEKQRSNGGVDGRAMISTIEDEEMASLRRDCLIEKWMENKKAQNKFSSLNDSLFFSSSSTSSDSSFESFNTSNSIKTSFSTLRSKQVNTPISCPDYDLFDREDEVKLITSKMRALNLYNNLKAAKQPISPGRRLTRFLNSLFSNSIALKKKTNNISSSIEDQHKSSCSSASSYSRSCLSKNSQGSNNIGVKRTVRFYPVSVIVDEECRPCGHKCIDEKSWRRKHVSELKSYQYQSDRRQNKDPSVRNCENDDDDDEDCVASDSSSDLFELDHLELIGDDRYCEELPVYETTCIDSNRAIANGLIR